MKRREFLAASAIASLAAAADVPKSKLGVATTCYMTVRRFTDTLEFLEHCHSIGAAGIQATLTNFEPAYLDKIARRLEETGMYLELMIGLPRTDMTRFVQTVDAAKRLNALCVRGACLSGRRYETFSTQQEWQKFISESEAAIARALPVVTKARMPLALENHKDWTVDEFVALLKKYDSEYLGVCLDTGNNISLLDDPMEVVERLAPYAISTHIKDMGVDEYPDGFLLSEVTIGTGFLDIPKIMATIQKARPKTKMTLEMITRDPLKVPALTDKYWVTFPNRSGAYLARTLRLVEKNKKRLPQLTTMQKPAQLAEEEQNVRKCLRAV